MKKVQVRKHTWLDCSIGWYVQFDGVDLGGEIYSQEDAIKRAKEVSVKLGVPFDENIKSTNEMFY